MAISVEREPQNLTPAYNRIIWVVSSDNVSECEFRYIADVYVGGVKVQRLKMFPDANGYGIFDVAGVLRSFLSPTKINVDDNEAFYPLSGHWVEYDIRFGEEYDSGSPCTGQTTVYPDLATENDRRAFLGGLHPHLFINYDDSYFNVSGNSKEFFTNMPATTSIREDGYQYLSAWQTVNDQLYYIQVLTYKEDGTLLGTYLIKNNDYTTTADRIINMVAGPAQLNGAALSVGVQPVIDDNVAYYTINILNSATNQRSVFKRFNVDRTCAKHTRQLVFLNRLGGWDCVTFTQAEQEFVDVRERKEYNKLMGTFTAGSPTGTWGYEFYDRGRSVYAVNAVERKIYNSGWVDEDTANWYRELFTSPEVYEIETTPNPFTKGSSNTHWNPVVVRSTEYERLYNRNKKMKKYVLEVESGYNEVIQTL